MYDLFFHIPMYMIQIYVWKVKFFDKGFEVKIVSSDHDRGFDALGSKIDVFPDTSSDIFCSYKIFFLCSLRYEFFEQFLGSLF